MSRVGRRRFPYTPSGRASARRESIRSGIPVSSGSGYGNIGTRSSSRRSPSRRSPNRGGGIGNRGGGLSRLRSAILQRLRRGNKRTY